MNTVSIKDLRNNLAQIIEEVAIAKQSVEITKFGKVKAMIVPVSSIGKPKEKKGLEAAFGIWKNRKDIKDSAKWVSGLRRRQSTRYGKIFS